MATGAARESEWHGRAWSARRRSRCAFTLIEMLVVVVLLGVVAGLVVPRMSTNDRRLAQARVREVASLLSVVAQRHTLTNDRLTLSYDRSTAVIELLVLRTIGEDARWARPEWAGDPLVPPVRLEGVELAEALFDGGRADTRSWRLDLNPGQPRPTIELLLRTPREASPQGAWLIELLPYSASPSMTDVGAAGRSASASGLRSVDLDAQGRGDSSW